MLILKALTFYALVGLFFYLNKDKVERQSFLILLKLNSFKDFIERSIKRLKFLKLLEPGIILIGIVGMIFSIYYIFSGIYEYMVFGHTMKTLSLVIPGTTIPKTNFKLPFIETILALLVIAVVHEFGHGFFAKMNNLDIKSAGLVLLGPLIGAFVEIDEEKLSKLDLRKKASILFAGPAFNVIFFLIFFSLSLSLIPILKFTYINLNHIILIDRVIHGSPIERSGIKDGYAIFAVDNRTFSNFSEFITYIKSVNEKNVTFYTDHGVFVVHPENRSGKPYYGFYISEYKVYKNKILYDLIQYLISLFSLIAMLNLGIGIANLLPISILDGGKFLFYLFESYLGTNIAEKLTGYITVITLLGILISMYISYI